MASTIDLPDIHAKLFKLSKKISKIHHLESGHQSPTMERVSRQMEYMFDTRDFNAAYRKYQAEFHFLPYMEHHYRFLTHRQSEDDVVREWSSINEAIHSFAVNTHSLQNPEVHRLEVAGQDIEARLDRLFVRTCESGWHITMRIKEVIHLIVMIANTADDALCRDWLQCRSIGDHGKWQKLPPTPSSIDGDVDSLQFSDWFVVEALNLTEKVTKPVRTISLFGAQPDHHSLQQSNISQGRILLRPQSKDQGAELRL